MSTVIDEPKALTEAPFKIEAITYPVLEAQIAKWHEQAMAIVVNDPNDKANYELAHKTRMTVREARVEIEKRRKALKASSLEYGRKVDSAAAKLTSLIEPIEAHLLAQEKIVDKEKERLKREAEEKKRQVTQDRVAACSKIGHAPNLATIGEMTAEQFEAYIAPIRTAHEAKVKAEQEAEAERQRLAKIEAERLAAERAELARQQAEQERVRRAEAEKLAAERAELERQRREQAEAQAKIDAENRRIAEEQAAKQREIDAAKAREEAAERARIEAERKRIADEQAAKERAAAEEAERLRLEALKPDRDKLVNLAALIEGVPVPEATTEEGTQAVLIAVREIRRVVGKIRELAAELE